jgi:phenylacetic acid degradation protein paaN
MSFQASAPHAADRALEAIALGYAEQSRVPAHTSWTKTVGKSTIALDKYWRIVPKGIALSIGCSTFPVWNSLPGIFASLITGNVVIVKPHPLGIYSIAIVVAELQQLFQSVGFDPNIIQLATDHQASPITKALCEHPAVQIIDYTGGSAFGDYIEALPNKTVFTEKAGVNSIILDSVADLNAVMQNLAFSVNLYSGQMCTCPQNFFIPKSGIQTANGPISYDETVAAFVQAVKGITENPKVGPAVCGAIQNPVTAQRVADLTAKGAKVLLPSQQIANPEFPKARTASPLVLEVAASDLSTISEELFGPIVLIIPTDSTDESVALAQRIAAEQGAISCGAYTTNTDTLAMIADKMTDSGTPVSFNLTGQIFVNQNAAFSDFHVTGANPAGNATFTDAAFVARRFNVVGIRVNAS